MTNIFLFCEVLHIMLWHALQSKWLLDFTYWMPGMKTNIIRTNQSYFSLLTCIANQVWDKDPDIKQTYYFVAN